MKRLVSIFIAPIFVIIFFLSGPIYALTLSSVDGLWSNPDPSDANINYYFDVPINYGNGQEDQIRWGQSTGQGQSGLGFTGISPPPFSFNVNDPFEIGLLRHFNEPIRPPSVSSVDLELHLSFSDPLINEKFTFTFQVNETPNNTGDDWLDRDFIYFPNAYPTENFELNGISYTLKLLGFGNDPTNLVSQFESAEHSINEAILWGQITTAPNAVPEPSTLFSMFLALVSFLSLYYLKRLSKE